MNQFQAYLQQEPLKLPESFHLCALFVLALTGVLAGIRRGYDVVGVFTLGLVVGAGGGLLRDGLFLQHGPPVLTQDWRYLPAVLAACVVGWLINHWIARFEKTIAILDAIALSIYSLVGITLSLEAGLSAPASVLVGVVNAAGGGVLRDVLTREEPLLFKPGQFYVLASCAGCVLFVLLAYYGVVTPQIAARISITLIFVLRILAITFNWRTSPVQPWFTASLDSPKTTSTPPVNAPK
jgi:uncharacterized membrane protein YeiH